MDFLHVVSLCPLLGTVGHILGIEDQEDKFPLDVLFCFFLFWYKYIIICTYELLFFKFKCLYFSVRKTKNMSITIVNIYTFTNLKSLILSTLLMKDRFYFSTQIS